MAAPLLKIVRSCRRWNSWNLRGFYRTLLSDEYKCDDDWGYRLNSKFLKEMDTRQFGYDLLKRFEKDKYISPMDMELFANNIHKLDMSDDELIEDIIFKYRHVDDSVPINDVIPHTLVRAYIERNRVDRLIMMMKDKVKYGIFPDFQAFCLLLDHLIDKNKYEDAAAVAGEVMLQEDFSHELCNLLCAYALTKCYKHTALGKPARDQGQQATDETKAEGEEEEMQYIPVPVIWKPHYDEHFDMVDERHLLGKSMFYFGKHTMDLTEVDARSMQLIGLGLYGKFEQGVRLIEHWLEEMMDQQLLHAEARESFYECLKNAPVRDENAEPVPLGRKTLEDCAQELWFTEAEKDRCRSKYEKFHSQLESHLSEKDLEKSVSFTLKTTMLEYEPNDMRIMRDNYHNWVVRRQNLMPEYLKEHKRHDKLKEIRQKLQLIHEKEELLSFFENKKEILMQVRMPKMLKKPKVEIDPEADQYVEAPGERNIKKTIKR